MLLSYSSGNYPKSTVSVYPPIFHFSLSDVRRSSLPVSNRNIHSYRRIHDAVEGGVVGMSERVEAVLSRRLQDALHLDQGLGQFGRF